MASYLVTTTNWNSSSFWSGIAETSEGHSLDFSGLPNSYSVDFDEAAEVVTISDGTTTFTVGEPGNGATDANLGGTTQFDYLNIVSGSAGDDSIDGGAGADTIFGGDGDDTLDGGERTARVAEREVLEWSAQGADETNIEGGFTASTGENTVTFSVTNDVSTNVEVETGQASNVTGVNTGGLGAVNPNSALEFETSAASDTATAQIDFSERTENVSFNVADLDSLSTMTILAYDVNGDPVPVSFSNVGTQISADAGAGTLTSILNGNLGAGSANGTATVTIEGPLSRIEITVDNGNGTGSNPQITDIYFDTVLIPGGDDLLFGNSGDDTFELNDGFGSDTVTGGEAGETTGDTLDASALTGVTTSTVTETLDSDPTTGTFFIIDSMPNIGTGANPNAVINVTGIAQYTSDAGSEGDLGDFGSDTINGQLIVSAGYFYSSDNSGQVSVNMGDGTALTAIYNNEDPSNFAIQFYELADGTMLAALGQVGVYPWVMTDEVIENGSGVVSFDLGSSGTIGEGPWWSGTTNGLNDLGDMGDVFSETTPWTTETTLTDQGVDVTATGDEAGTLEQGDNSVDYVEIEEFVLTEFDDTANFDCAT